MLDKAKISGIIEHMTTQEYTPEQLAEFHEFCLRHEIVFAIIAEFNGAIAQYFLED